MSPHFCYRVDLPGAGTGIRPLSDYALASRLSYFLWSSMPDDELLARAAAGDLHRPEVLVAQARRMLRDDRVRGLATEFGGNWLDFRRFEEHNSVDRARFPTFNDELRRSMFEEPIRFFIDLVQNDRSVHELLDAKYTFVNPALARHYGMPEPTVGPDGWVRVDDARPYGRGGLLPMAVFLTKNSPGLRTSPVKRGYWVVRRLLGENIPAPPPNVPELPSDEAKLGDLTLRQALARHRADKSCAGCHERFDAIGLAFEGYGPVGEFRTSRPRRPARGHPRDVPRRRRGDRSRRACAPTSTSAAGDEFVDNLCRKLLAYALGRSLLPSDDETIERHAHAAGGRRRPIRQSGREHRHQPAVPEQASRKRNRRRNEDHERIRAGTEASGRASQASRRTFLRGVGVTMALPWLESVPVWGAAADGRRPARALPEAVRRPVHGLRRQPDQLVGQGRRRRDGAGPVPGAAGAAQGQDQRRQRPVQQARHGRGHPPGPDRQHPLGGRASERGRAQGGHQHRPGARQAPGRGDGAAQHGPGLRAADHRLPRDQLLDGLQLAHLLAERDLAGADGGLSVAGLRQPVRQPRQPAQPEHPRPRARGGRGPEPAGQLGRPGQARRVSHERPRGRETGRADAGRQAEGRRASQRPGPARLSRCNGRTTACPKTSASTCG